jgi:chlorobactene glucosyltransferase
MYKGYVAGIRGIGKNIFDFLGKNDIILMLIAVTILIFFVPPFPLLFLLIAAKSPFVYYCLAVNILFTVTWLVMFLGRRINWLFTFFWPAMYINLLAMVLWSWFRTVSGRGFVWKGRIVR